MTETRKNRPTNCIICSKPLTIASRGTVRLTCSDRCRQIKKRYKGWHQWRDAIYYRVKERRIDKLLRQVERTIGTMDFPFNPAHPDLTMGEMVKRTFMRSLNGRVEDLTYCGNCGRPYVPIGNRWKYWEKCSESCARSYARNVKLESASFYANPRRMPEEVMDSLRKRKRVKLCAHCDGAFVPKGRRKYCTDKCKDAAYWKRRPRQRCKVCGKTYRGHTMTCSKRCYEVAYRCRHCHKAVRPGSGIVFDASTKLVASRMTVRPIVFCSEACRDAMGWMFVPKRCEWCQQVYAPKTHYNLSKYCSERCRTHANHAKKRERLRAERAATPRECRECGEVVPVHRTRAALCSDECRKAAKRRSAIEQWQTRKAIPLPMDWPGLRVPASEHVSTSAFQLVSSQLAANGERQTAKPL